MPELARSTHIVLVGLMGSGKTTLGGSLAKALGRSFSDSDEYIERTTGRTVRELADDAGVDAMHKLEKAHLLDALGEPKPSVVAAAASTIEDQECREALGLEGVTVIWLRADIAVLAERFERNVHRPRFGQPPARLLADQSDRREPLFAALGGIRIDTHGRATTEVVDAILGRRG
jgi:shikimate kinase